MIKAIFMDYYGTVAHENGPIAMEVVKRVYKSSNAQSPEEVFRYWWKTFKEKLTYANGENFHTQHEVALDNFKDLLEHFHSPENPEELLARMEEHWCTTPVYEDARIFMEKVKLPIYFVTNSDDKYVYGSLKKYDLHPEGVITSEQAKYSKPRKEIFLYALERTGWKAEEVIHVGDSLEGDVKCAGEAGIRSIWLNREAKSVPENVVSAGNFSEVLKILDEAMTEK